MFGDLRAWAFSICAASVAVSLYKMIIPQNKSAKAVKMVAEMFLLLAIVSPLTTLKIYDEDVFDRLYLEENITNGEEIAREITENQIKSAVSQLVYDKLKIMGILTPVVRIDINVQDENLMINKVEVIIPSSQSDMTGQIKEFIEGELNLISQVTIKDEE